MIRLGYYDWKIDRSDQLKNQKQWIERQNARVVPKRKLQQINFNLNIWSFYRSNWQRLSHHCCRARDSKLLPIPIKECTVDFAKPLTRIDIRKRCQIGSQLDDLGPKISNVLTNNVYDKPNKLINADSGEINSINSVWY